MSTIYRSNTAELKANTSQGQFDDEVDSLLIAEHPALLEAIHRGDFTALARLSTDSRSVSTLYAKQQAILSGRADVLTFLLDRDASINEILVSTAAERKDYRCVSQLLISGWTINRSLNGTASILRCALLRVRMHMY